MTCYQHACNQWSNYWYIAAGKRIGMCFGHATRAVREGGEYGRRERKERP